MLLVQDTGSGRRLVDRVDVALGDLSYTAAAEDIIRLLGKPGHGHPQQESKADTARVQASLQTQIVQTVTSIQQYQDRLPAKAAFTCRSVTVVAPAKRPVAPDARDDRVVSVHRTCLLHIRLTPAGLDAPAQPLDRYQHMDTSCDESCSRMEGNTRADMRPSQAGDALIKVARPAALRLELCQLPKAAEQSGSKQGGWRCGSGKLSAGTSGSAVDDLVDRDSHRSQAASSVIVHKACNEPGLALTCSMGQASISMLGSGVHVRTACASSTFSVHKTSCAKPGLAVGQVPWSNSSLSLDTALDDVQLVCDCGTLAQFDKVHRIVEMMNGGGGEAEVMAYSKSVEDNCNDESTVKPAQGRQQSVGMEVFAGGGLPGLDWRVKLAVEQGFSVRLLSVQDTDSTGLAMSGEESAGIPQAIFQLGVLDAEASGGLERHKPGTATAAGGLQSALATPQTSSKDQCGVADGRAAVAGVSEVGLHAQPSGVLSFCCDIFLCSISSSGRAMYAILFP